MEISTIGKELDVDYLVQGSLLKFGDTIRFWIKLIDIRENLLIWTEPFTFLFEAGNIYAVHTAIASRVV
ncbi:MAG: hypothetical protein KFF73_14945 [Cyclobacteriaceae bacterium]|nr:hypothetical protein [Cyclobacteriaceae bacterium]